MTGKLKTSTCRVCQGEYLKRGMRQIVCSPLCAAKWPEVRRQQEAEKAARKQLAKDRERLKTKGDWLKEAQASFNAYIRARDYGKPCISSGVMEQERFTGGHFDAGHYRSTGAAAHLRFNCWNVHAQSKRDNRELSGNVVEYRIRLIDRIGLDRVEALEQDNTPRTFDIAYLKRVKRIFRKRANLYKRIKGIA